MSSPSYLTPEFIQNSLRNHRKVYSPHPAQRKFHEARKKYRYRVLAAGRRFGKDLCALFDALQICFEHPGGKVVVIGRTNEHQRENFNYAQSWFPRSLYHVNKQYKEIILKPPYESLIAFRSAEAVDPMRGMGSDLQRVIFTEAAYIPREIWINTRPALMDNMAGADFLSTPNMHNAHNHFYEFFMRGQEYIEIDCPECHRESGHSECPICHGKGFTSSPNPIYDPDWISSQHSSYENTSIPKSEIDDCIKDLGLVTQEDILREIYGEFISGTSEFLTHDEIMKVVNKNRPVTLEPNLEDTYIIGVDPARSRDYTAVIVMDQNHRVCDVKAMQGLWATIKQRVKRIWERYGRGTVVIDSTREENFAHDLMIDLGVRPVIPVYFNVTGRKYEIMTAMQSGILEEDMELPNHPELINQLCNLTVKSTGSGMRTKIEAGRGKDDLADGLAMAYYYTLKIARGETGGIKVAVI